MRVQRSSGLVLCVALLVLLACAPGRAQAGDAQAAAREILEVSGVRGGLIAHYGCGDGRVTAALRVSESYLVHGLDADEADVEKARAHICSLGLYGPVSVERWTGKRLPYVDNLVNLLVAEDLGQVPMDEVNRVLCPGGVACVRQGDKWVRTVKPRPADMDEWTHYLHDATGNPVARDKLVGPPRRLQWVAGPEYGRHHDHMSSLNAAVSAGGRVFYIMDEGSRASIFAPPSWKLIARDAFNGTLLWKRQIPAWHTHLQRLKGGPALLPRRLVALADRVHVTLGLDAPVTALDAATGETVKTYQGTEAAREIIASDGVLFLVVDKPAKTEPAAVPAKKGAPGAPAWWDQGRKRIVALNAASGAALWTVESWVVPMTLAADGGRVYFADEAGIVCLDRRSGQQVWRSEPLPRAAQLRSNFAPTLIAHGDVVLFAGGEAASKLKAGGQTEGQDTLAALAAQTGKLLWKAPHPPSGYMSPEDVFAVGGLVWTGATTGFRDSGHFTGRDPQTGEIKVQFDPDTDTYWFHHRCHRGKATENYLLTSRTGIEFIDFRQKHWIPNHWVRGACIYGVMPCNGLIYAPQHPCACYLEAKLSGFNALAPGGDGPRVSAEAAGEGRLEPGPAYGAAAASTAEHEEDWPTYRHDPARSGRSPTRVPATLKRLWQTALGGRLSSPVVADGKVILSSVDGHAVHALDAGTGKELWRFTAGGRVDSPPTVHQGLVLFGSADGHVYCLRAGDGAPAWRLRAAPMDQRLMAREQLESVWSVPGSVLVQNGALYCVAGRSMFLDGGLRLLRLDPKTGRVLSETILDDRDPATGKDLQSHVSWLNMPVALPDILSSDGKLVFMRSQPFDLSGARLPLEKIPAGPDVDRGAPPATQRADRAHLFSPTGFLDGSHWHRTYWLYGSIFVSGWCGYFLAGKTAPAGNLLVFDETCIYGFGRRPQFYRWTTPMEFHLFATDKATPAGEGAPAGKTAPAAQSAGRRWSRDVPLLARAMVLAGETLFVAGPADVLDETLAAKQRDDPQIQQRIAEQAEALEGRKGALLVAVSARDGTAAAEWKLDAPPVHDGMAAARGRLYISSADGKLVCMGGE